MDVVFLDRLRNQRGLVLETTWRERMGWQCTVMALSGCPDYTHESYCMTRDEWIEWASRFQDELTGKDFREIMAAIDEPFEEPDFWADFRKRYIETGDPWKRQ